MHVYDLEGNKLFITDLDKAIQQANLYKDYKHDSPGFHDLDVTLQTYWTDLLNKLLKLKDEDSS